MRLVLILLAASSLHGATYYVATTGSNSNTCTQAQSSTTPKLYVSQGVACAQSPGDIVMIAAGTYGSEGYISDGTGGLNGLAAPVNITWAGTSAAPITVRGADPNNRPVLNCGTNWPTLGCDNYINLQSTAAYWVFQYLRITGGATSGIGGGNHIKLLNSEHDHNGNISYTGQYGLGAIGWGTGTDWTIDSCSIHDNGRLVDQQLDHGIYAHGGPATITNNLFYNLSKGWHIQIADGAHDWTIVNNTFAFPATQLYSSNTGQIMLWNTNTNITIRNNVFFQPKATAITRYTATITNGIFDTNVVYPAVPVISDPTGFTITNTINGNPNLSNTATTPYNFAPTPPSPAIDAGLTVGSITHDYAGTARPQPPGGAYDIGAYEYVPTTPCTIAPTVLGPWTVTQVISQVLTASGTCGTTAWTLTGSWPPGLSGCSSGAGTTCTVSGTISGLVRIVPHNVLLAWQDMVNPSGTTYNAYRATGRCVSPSAFSQIASGVMATTYTDLSVPAGSYCYQVTAVAGGLESSPTPGADASVPSAYAPVVAYGTASNTYAITVDPTPAVTVTALPAGVTGVAYSQQVPTTGGSGTVSCSMSSGSLPLGLTLSSGCLVSGTPAAAGSSTFSVQTMDVNSVATTSPLTMAVNSTAPTSGITVSGGTTCGACVF